MNKIVIIGGGIAGYTLAFQLAAKNNQVTLIEKNLLGGTCLNNGCMPTKLLLNITRYEDNLQLVQKEKNTTIQYLRSVISFFISLKKIIYFKSEAKILKNNYIFLKQLNKKIKYDYLILAVGSQPIIPKSLINDSLLTSDQALDINKIPKSLLIIGAGYIGIEFAHIFNNLNSKVYVVEKKDTILPTLDKEASNCLLQIMEKKGIKIFTNTEVKIMTNNIARLSNGNKIKFEKSIVCVGRLGSTIESEILIDYENNFIKTNDYFQTSQKNIFAIGDCTSDPLLAHKAEYDAVLLADNLLNNGRKKRNYNNIPVCIYSRPEIAFIGQQQGLEKIKVEFKNIGKSYCDKSTQGFLEIYIDKNKKIYGGLVVNNNAQEILAGLIPIVNANMSCEQVIKMVWCHPTSSEIIKEVAKKALR